MNDSDMFSIDKDTIDINGMDAMVELTGYKPFDTDDFLEGLELSEDLVNKFGTVLYAKGTTITPNHLARLIELRASNPALDFFFRINKSAKLVQEFRSVIKEQIFSLFSRQVRTNIYGEFLKGIGDNLENFINDILSEENITLLMYQMRFVSRATHKDKSTLFMEHPVNVALIALAIASSKPFETIIGKSKTKLLDVCRAGLFHNYGALMHLSDILDTTDELRLKLYWDSIREGIKTIDNSNLGYEIRDALTLLCDYQTGRTDSIHKPDWTSVLANIIIVSELFLRRESGLFSEPQQVKKIVDQLNVRVAENRLGERPVLALTIGLNLLDIFDFYRELNSLIRKCPYNSAVPYPLVGFKSPTIFVCKNDVVECKYIEGSLKAVNLLHDMGELKRGQYRRCWLLTPKLISFYKKHYRAIKGIANNGVAAKEK